MKLTQLAAAVAMTSMLAACGGSSGGSDNDATDNGSQSVINVSNVERVLDTNANIALAAYNDAIATAEDLRDALAAFRSNPTAETFLAAKQAWLVAREPYGQTEVYRFRLSPIDSSDYSTEDGPEGDINAWPLGEALIDYVEVNTTDFGTDEIGVTDNSVEVGTVTAAGAYEITADNYDANENIIGRIDITIDENLLANTATADDEHDVIAGYHAIEFLLWGQDLKADGTPTDGTDRDQAVKVDAVREATDPVNTYAFGGERPLTDLDEGYTDAADYNSENLKHRRHKFMEVAVEKLIADLTTVRDGWGEGAAYRTAFTTIADEDEAREKLTEILTGMGTLAQGELAGERMQIAFSSNSQEDEHSCFSDNTHRDIWLNAEGILNSYYGDYAGYDSTLDGTDNETGNAVNGYGIDDYLADAGLTSVAADIEAALAATRTQYEAIDSLARDGQPFDVQIMTATADEPTYQAITALTDLAGEIEDVAEALELNSDVTDDDATGCDTTQPDAECEG